MHRWISVLLLGSSIGMWAQNPSSGSPGSPAGSAPEGSQPRDSSSNSGPAQTNPTAKPAPPNLAAPRSGSVNADALEEGESSSKDTQVDLNPPADDARAHPHSGDALMDAEMGSGSSDVSEFHPFDPHKAAKDIEVGDYYFKRKNYRGAEDRYREALYYKDNDALATFRLAVCLEKMDRPDDARKEYESYLKILPHGPQVEDAKKAIDRLKGPDAGAKPAK